MLYACIPDGVPAFATTCVTAFAGAALLFVPFRARLAAAVRAGGRRFVAAVFGLAVLSASYNTLYLFGSKAFDVASGAFTFCMTVVVMAAIETLIVAPAVALVYPEVDAVFLAWAVFGNTAGFPILFGIPLSILLQEEFGFEPAGRNSATPRDTLS